MKAIAGLVGMTALVGCAPPIPGFRFAHYKGDSIYTCKPYMGDSPQRVRAVCGEPDFKAKGFGGKMSCWAYRNRSHGIGIGSPAPWVAVCFANWGGRVELTRMLALDGEPPRPAKASSDGAAKPK